MKEMTTQMADNKTNTGLRRLSKEGVVMSTRSM